MDDDRLKSLIKMYETAIAELHQLHDPEVEAFIVRLEVRESSLLLMIEEGRQRGAFSWLAPQR